MKEELNFPEKWYILGNTEEFRKYCDKYKANVAGIYSLPYFMNTIEYNNKNWSYNDLEFLSKDYKEISFKEFQQYILKELPKENLKENINNNYNIY